MTDYERFGDYQPSDRSRVGTALAFLFIGLGIGTAVSLLFSPKSGKQIRRSLKRKYEDYRDVVEDFSDQASDVIGKGAGWAKDAKDRVSPIADRVAPFAKAAAKKARDIAK